MTKYILITLLGLFNSLYSCSQENKTMENKVYNALIEYPYVASKERKNIILDNMNKLKSGMNKKEVIQLLTLPDEINEAFPLIKTAKEIIGFSYVYIIERKQDIESRKLIRIHFDLNEVLINAYAIGIPEFNEIEKQ
ncbi:MAG: hypothetical protein K8R54_07500 [Bacteroidales bacterium]|nr:hypothetical protein [Bacteroidales bacterium]